MFFTILAGLYAVVAAVSMLATYFEGRSSATGSLLQRIEGLVLALFWPLLIVTLIIQATLEKRRSAQEHHSSNPAYQLQ